MRRFLLQQRNASCADDCGYVGVCFFCICFQLLLEVLDTSSHGFVAKLERALARAPHADAALLPREMAPEARKARQQVLELRQLLGHQLPEQLRVLNQQQVQVLQV